jgi:hypothetical protein
MWLHLLDMVILRRTPIVKSNDRLVAQIDALAQDEKPVDESSGQQNSQQPDPAHGLYPKANAVKNMLIAK